MSLSDCMLFYKLLKFSVHFKSGSQYAYIKTDSKETEKGGSDWNKSEIDVIFM